MVVGIGACDDGGVARWRWFVTVVLSDGRGLVTMAVDLC